MSEYSITREEQTEEVFKYLDKLRDNGITYMYGAAKYIKIEYGMGIKEARNLLNEWIEERITI